MKFDEQEQMRQQQYAMFQQANSAGLKEAVAMHRQTQQGYAAMNQAESAAATHEEGEITEQRRVGAKRSTRSNVRHEFVRQSVLNGG